MSEHLTESREDLETRFLVMASFIKRGRELSDPCETQNCPACLALGEAVSIPATVMAAAHEPREDLEQAVVSINDRLETVAALPDNDCPGRAFIVGLLHGTTEPAA